MPPCQALDLMEDHFLSVAKLVYKLLINNYYLFKKDNNIVFDGVGPFDTVQFTVCPYDFYRTAYRKHCSVDIADQRWTALYNIFPVAIISHTIHVIKYFAIYVNNILCWS